MKFFLFSLLLVVSLCISESDYLVAFQNYQKQFNKKYEPTEVAKRYFAFKNTLDFIHEHNAKGTFTVALNELSDLTRDEYLDRLNPMRLEHYEPTKRVKATYDPTWDWRTKGAVSSVKNQGQCGSCWAFSTAATVEGCVVVDGKGGKGPLQDVSEQEIVDCATGNYGCDGGWPQTALKWVESTKGLCSEASYPYTAQTGTCKASGKTPISKVGNHTIGKSGDENDLGNNCQKHGPISVCIDASHPSFQSYSSGVYYEAACSSSHLDHAVLAVGWGTDSGKQYWIVKNSWGTSWGIKGYIWMSRNRNNNCGIATNAVYAEGCAKV